MADNPKKALSRNERRRMERDAAKARKQSQPSTPTTLPVQEAGERSAPATEKDDSKIVPEDEQDGEHETVASSSAEGAAPKDRPILKPKSRKGSKAAVSTHHEAATAQGSKTPVLQMGSPPKRVPHTLAPLKIESKDTQQPSHSEEGSMSQKQEMYDEAAMASAQNLYNIVHSYMGPDEEGPSGQEEKDPKSGKSTGQPSPISSGLFDPRIEGIQQWPSKNVSGKQRESEVFSPLSPAQSTRELEQARWDIERGKMEEKHQEEMHTLQSKLAMAESEVVGQREQISKLNAQFTNMMKNRAALQKRVDKGEEEMAQLKAVHKKKESMPAMPASPLTKAELTDARTKVQEQLVRAKSFSSEQFGQVESELQAKAGQVKNLEQRLTAAENEARSSRQYREKLESKIKTISNELEALHTAQANEYALRVAAQIRVEELETLLGQKEVECRKAWTTTYEKEEALQALDQTHKEALEQLDIANGEVALLTLEKQQMGTAAPPKTTKKVGELSKNVTELEKEMPRDAATQTDMVAIDKPPSPRQIEWPGKEQSTQTETSGQLDQSTQTEESGKRENSTRTARSRYVEQGTQTEEPGRQDGTTQTDGPLHSSTSSQTDAPTYSSKPTQTDHPPAPLPPPPPPPPSQPTKPLTRDMGVQTTSALPLPSFKAPNPPLRPLRHLNLLLALLQLLFLLAFIAAALVAPSTKPTWCLDAHTAALRWGRRVGVVDGVVARRVGYGFLGWLWRDRRLMVLLQ